MTGNHPRRAACAAQALCGLLIASHTALCAAADKAPSDAAVAKVFKETVESAPSVEMKPGETCARPSVRRFDVLKRGAFTRSAQMPNGFYPVTASVELACKQTADASATPWKGQIELQVYENALQLWQTRW